MSPTWSVPYYRSDLFSSCVPLPAPCSIHTDRLAVSGARLHLRVLTWAASLPVMFFSQVSPWFTLSLSLNLTLSTMPTLSILFHIVNCTTAVSCASVPSAPTCHRLIPFNSLLFNFLFVMSIVYSPHPQERELNEGAGILTCFVH